MTNQEAIIKLTNIMHDDHYSWHPAVLTAFGMAVDALKGAEGDCISRKAAIDALDKRFDSIPMEQTVEVLQLRRDLRELPSVTPEQRWIPCGKCIHADGKHRWCKILDRSINEDYFCYWAEPYQKEGEADEAD